MNDLFLQVLKDLCWRSGKLTPRDHQKDPEKFEKFLGVLSGKVPAEGNGTSKHIHNLLLAWVRGAGKPLMLSALMLFALEADPTLSVMICACPNKAPRLDNIAKFRSMASSRRTVRHFTYGLGKIPGCE